MKQNFCSAKVVRLSVAVALTVLGGIALTAAADDTKTDTTKADAKPKAAKKLTGAELYAVNCNRCHPERYPTEFSAAQWQTIMLQMRVRANLPAKQANEILKYLKDEAGN